MPAREHKKFAYLNQIHCGEVVHLQIVTATKLIRLKTRLIGIDPNMPVILAIGSDASWVKAKPYILESTHVIVRLLNQEKHQAHIIAFRSTIQKIISVAGRWLVLDYPRAIESSELRQYPRIPVKVMATLNDNSIIPRSTNGLISDLSIQGCAFIADHDAELHLNALYRLKIVLEEDESSFELEVDLKNRHTFQTVTGETQTQYGVVFQGIESETKQCIQQLLLHYLEN